MSNNQVPNDTEWRKGATMSNFLNNMGYTLQELGTVNTYEWDITYSFIYYE